MKRRLRVGILGVRGIICFFSMCDVHVYGS